MLYYTIIWYDMIWYNILYHAAPADELKAHSEAANASHSAVKGLGLRVWGLGFRV